MTRTCPGPRPARGSVDPTPALPEAIARPGSIWQTLKGWPWDRRFRLGRCPHCNGWQTLELIEQDTEAAAGQSRTCPGCQTRSALALWDQQHCLEPAGFRTDFRPSGQPLEGLEGRSSQGLVADAMPPERSSWIECSHGSLRLQVASSSGLTVYRLNRGPGGKGFAFRWREGELRRPDDGGRQLRHRPDKPMPLQQQLIERRLLDRRGLNTILAEPHVDPTAAEQIDPVSLVAPRVTDALYLLPVGVHPQLATGHLGGQLPVPGNPQGDQSDHLATGEHYWQGVRAAALSACQILIGAATRYLDVDHSDLEAVEPRPFLFEGEQRPLIQLVDAHVNGAGFCAWLGSPGSACSPPVISLLASEMEAFAEQWSDSSHGLECKEACYSCLKTYENQNLHGLLDWRLGLTYWRAFCDPSWSCGLDGDFSWGPLRDWQDQAEACARLTLNLWGGDSQEDLIRSSRRDGLRLLAFRLPMVGPVKRPWVIVRHPLWLSGLDQGVLAEFKEELSSGQPGVPVLIWDTFNLQRRPGRCRQWMQLQAGRRRRRARRSHVS